MQTKDATEILKRLGWEPHRDEIGDMFAYYHLPDRIVRIHYGVIDYGQDSGRLWVSSSLTTVAYCLGCEYINGKESQHQYEDMLISSEENFGVTALEFFENHVKVALNKVLAWAQEQDIEQKLREESANHSLIAKALLGDIEALRNYKSTSQLYTPEFSDYEKMTQVERAIFFAEAYKNNELDDLLARKKPKQRSISLTTATRILKTQGWLATEPGKMWLVLPDRFIQFDFGFIRLHDDYNVHLEAEISNEEISVACHYIHDSGKCRKISATNIYQSFNTIGGGLFSGVDKGIDIRVETLNEQELIKISERIIQWARAQDLQGSIEGKTLVQKYNYNTDIIWHLACLALTGKINVLKSYQNLLALGTISEHLESNIVEKSVKYAVEFAEKHLKILKEREVADARIGVQFLALLNTVSKTLKMMNWTVYRDKNYNYNAYFISKDRIINIVYSFDRKGKIPVVVFKASLSTLAFSTAHRDVFFEKPQYIALKEAEEVYTVSSVEVEEGKLKQICADILEWADQQNVNQIIYDYAALPTDSEFCLAEFHLIALILTGNVKKLKFYKESFQRKNYLGFVDTIIRYDIDKALTLAQGYRTGFPKNAPILFLDSPKTSLDSKTALLEEEEIDEVDETDVGDDRLTMESATTLLKSLNWAVKKIARDDYIASYQLADREVDVLYNDEIAKDYPQFDSAFLISTGILAAACKVIDPTHTEDIPDIQLNFEAKGLEIFEPEVTADRLKQALDDALEWAVSAIDLSERLRCDYGLAPWEKDATSKASNKDYALLHLGALALLGDIESLQSYQQSFVTGDHLGFEENINQTHLERALVLAEEVSKAKQLSYALIKQVGENLDEQREVSSEEQPRSWKEKITQFIGKKDKK
ncbi:hypothetical protein MEI_00411 [Bartonella vinsonii subsp. arupensis Pm136co]|uniref:Uncharacterized protein n=1 Tax=Bartonella vinsonii subsp. arupensis Pm136co TaxID=1094561 RepID=A0ABN0GR71_BARVI|nr:hypothetical protein [Bartonella vinsonii]EJF98588.1 hypothetical protein MEI_00411 [Bartonella vinsonii subsp. arupensis Pm136co]